MSEKKEAKRPNYCTYVFRDEENGSLMTATQKVEGDDADFNLAPNMKFYLKMFPGETKEECFEAGQRWLKEYLSKQSISFEDQRTKDKKFVEAAKDSYVKYEDGSIVPIVPQAELEMYKQRLGIKD
jgi:hypothetical protein